MKLSAILQNCDIVLDVRGEAEVSGLCCDTRQLQKGDLYFCLSGMKVDGHSYAAQALEKGAVALVVERYLDEADCPQVLVSDSRAAMAYFAAEFYGNPSRDLKMIGVTGTKGKTSTTYFIKSILDNAGIKTGLIGTVSIIIGQEEIPSKLTTPDPIDFQRTLRRMADAGCRAVVMEVSGHALALRKMEGMHFDVGVYTNLSEDHLDMFKTMDNMAAAKRRLFEKDMCAKAVINSDDEHGSMMAVSPEVVTYGVSQPETTARAWDIEIRDSGASFTLDWRKESTQIQLNISGLFNVYNSMAAATACLELGISMDEVKKGLEAISVVPGRLELIPTATPYRVILDYAHSPDSLRSVLETVRKFTSGRLICLFGCGGNREKEKRPIMGGIAGRLADYVFITSDNPRYEKPEEIIAEIEAGIRDCGTPYTVIENRKEAIAAALKMAREGDILLLVGKGHETYQEIAGERRPFDEKQIVQELLAEMA